MKLRVGDIEMDSSTGIVMTGAPGSARAALHESGHGHEQPRDLLHELRLPALPASVCWAIAAASALASVSVVTLLAAGLVQNLFLAGVLPPLLGLCAGSVVMARRAGMAGETGLAPAELRALRATRVAAVLSTATEPLTVERIAALLGWTEPAVVTGLGQLVREGRAHEDIDLTSGHWVYSLLAHAESHTSAALPIAERERALVE